MKTLTLAGARHFASGFSRTSAPSSRGVEKHLRLAHPGCTDDKPVVVNEGTSDFDAIRSCLLREADRCAFLALSCYARSLSSLRASSSFWSVVGLYYSSFYSARAILGHLGCWIRNESLWLEASRTNPGHQQLTYHRDQHPSAVGGSHQLFWRAYYPSVAPLETWLSASAKRAVTPIGNDPVWFIGLRNKVNYDPLAAMDFMTSFRKSFDDNNVPGCFQKELGSAYSVASSFIAALEEITTKSAMKTDTFLPSRTRRGCVRAHITGPKSRALTAFAKRESKRTEF